MGTIGVKDIMAKYGLGRKKVVQLLHTEGCPLVHREKHQSYRVPEEAYDKWLTRQVYHRKEVRR